MSLFIISPDPEKSFRSKAYLLFKFFLLSQLFKVIGVLFTTIAIKAGLKDVSILMAGQSKSTDYYLLMIVIYPILEEFAFRGWFSKYKLLISISLTTLLFYLSYIIIFRSLSDILPFSDIQKEIAIAIILCSGFFIFFKKILTIQNFIERRHSSLIFLSIMSFTAIHIMNYNFSAFSFLKFLAIIIVMLPYPFRAYLLTYIRIKAGLPWSIALHILNNSFILIPVLMGHKDI